MWRPGLNQTRSKDLKMGCKIYQTNLYHYAGTGHLAIDYPRLMRLGVGGIQAEAEAGLNALSKRDPEYCEKRDFYRAILIMYRAVEQYILRYASLADQMAQSEPDPVRQKELLQIAANCRQISSSAPQTFWQALQLFNLMTTLIQVESNGHSISYGRMDNGCFHFMKPTYVPEICAKNLPWSS